MKRAFEVRRNRRPKVGTNGIALSQGLVYGSSNTRAAPLVRKDDAHQGRVFYCAYRPIKPTLPNPNVWNPPHVPGNDRLFCTLLILNTMLKQCATMQAFAATWRQRVEDLIGQPPAVANAQHLMGLTPTWKAHVCWA